MLVARGGQSSMQMHIRVISVGRERGNEFTSLAVQDYATRIRRSAELDLVELPAGAGSTSRDREAEGILATHGKALARGPSELWAIDERGEQMTSGALADRIGRLRDTSMGLNLAIGGDEGLSTRVIAAAQFRWSLSLLTLPHRLARVVVLEQIYRAFEILRRSPYHK
jgi:23S rRNA (pseudouridine1915-N3)-methyltransferase